VRQVLLPDDEEAGSRMAQPSVTFDRKRPTLGSQVESRSTAVPTTGGRTLSLRQAYATVFTASACTLVIELLAGRLMAPYLGVSLYTWTSIIG
jgi:hypothetical protein